MDASTASMRPTMFTAFPLKQAGGAAQRPDPVAAQIAAGLVGPGLHEFVGLIPLDGLVLTGVTAPQALAQCGRDRRWATVSRPSSRVNCLASARASCRLPGSSTPTTTF